uniref:Uncharacterized protein n=1 Tax=Romanomermis culicivorax TaxID=13658 RepID=A0A915JTF9_ROMCU
MVELVEKCAVFVSDGRSIILSQRPWYTNYIKLMEKLNRIMNIDPSSIQTIYFNRPLKPLRKSDEMYLDII